MSARAYVRIQNGPAAGQDLHVFPVPTLGFEHPVYSIGRDSRCDLQLNDPQIAAVHAVILCNYATGEYAIKGNARNTVILDGTEVPSGKLKPGSVLRIGNTQMRFSLQAGKGADQARAGQVSARPRQVNSTALLSAAVVLAVMISLLAIYLLSGATLDEVLQVADLTISDAEIGGSNRISMSGGLSDLASSANLSQVNPYRYGSLSQSGVLMLSFDADW